MRTLAPPFTNSLTRLRPIPPLHTYVSSHVSTKPVSSRGAKVRSVQPSKGYWSRWSVSTVCVPGASDEHDGRGDVERLSVGVPRRHGWQRAERREQDGMGGDDGRYSATLEEGLRVHEVCGFEGCGVCVVLWWRCHRSGGGLACPLDPLKQLASDSCTPRSRRQRHAALASVHLQDGRLARLPQARSTALRVSQSHWWTRVAAGVNMRRAG